MNRPVPPLIETWTSQVTISPGEGTGWGPPQDFQDAEAVVRLNSAPDKAMCFQLRPDAQRVARQAEFDLLRDAFNNDWNVTIDYDIPDGKKNGRLIR